MTLLSKELQEGKNKGVLFKKKKNCFDPLLIKIFCENILGVVSITGSAGHNTTTQTKNHK